MARRHHTPEQIIKKLRDAEVMQAAGQSIADLVKQLEHEGIGIFLISHDIHDVFDLSHRIAVMYHGRIVGIVNKDDVTPDDVLGMIIMGKPLAEVTQEEIATLH